MNLSRYVCVVKEQFYNTVTGKHLPLDTDTETLKANLFLAGQETESLHARLFGKITPNILKLSVIPTWECSLRCTHCCVANRLVRKQDNNLDVEAIQNFIDSFCNKYNPDGVYLAIIGGEPLLDPISCLKLAKHVRSLPCQKFIQITTNLVQEIDELVLDIIDEADLIAVSLDGNQKQHNNQRRSTTLDDPYQVTLENIQKILQYGFADKLHVQAAMLSTNTDISSKKEYYRTLLSMGVKFENITYGTLFPTLRKPNADPNFIEIASRRASPLPCCRYRYMSNFVIDATHKIYVDYLDETKADVVGDLSNLDWDSIEKNYKSCILRTMHVLHDEKCMTCPAIGVCWGGCVHNQHVNGGKPSNICNQQQTIKYLTDLVESGRVIEVVDKFVTNKQCRINFIER